MRYDKLDRRVVRAEERRKGAEESERREKARADALTRILHDALHDLRRLSDIISSKAEDLAIRLEGSGDSVAQGLNNTIYYSSGMLAARLAYVDISLDPQAAAQQAKVRIGLYKKFEKSLRLLGSNLREKHIRYHISGASHTTFEANKAFELVPFLLLDNAIKYSPDNQTINITFSDIHGRHIDVAVASVGPAPHDHELEAIFEEGFRGDRARRSGVRGDGVGLHMVKILCDMELVRVRAERGKNLFSLNGVDYCDFVVRLSWSK